MALSAKMRWRLLHGGKNPQYGEFHWLGNAKCANKQINLSPNQKMYESAESGVWRVALGVWGGPIWQHAVSIMENHLQTNKYKEIPRSLNNSRWCSYSFCCFHTKKLPPTGRWEYKKCRDFHSFLYKSTSQLCLCVYLVLDNWCDAPLPLFGLVSLRPRLFKVGCRIVHSVFRIV